MLGPVCLHTVSAARLSLAQVDTVGQPPLGDWVCSGNSSGSSTVQIRHWL